MQQYILWAEVRKETKRLNGRWTVRDLLANGIFFFVYSLLACDISRSWQQYAQSVSCPLSARWRLVANTPFALRPGLSHEDVMRTNGITKEREASVTVEGKTKGRKTPPTPFLRTQWVGSVESLPRPAPSPPLLAPPAIPAPPLRKPR